MDDFGIDGFILEFPALSLKLIPKLIMKFYGIHWGRIPARGNSIKSDLLAFTPSCRGGINIHKRPLIIVSPESVVKGLVGLVS